MRDHSHNFTLRVVNEGFSCVTPERWKKLVNHVQQKIEDHYWEHDGLCETMVDRLSSIWEAALKIHCPVQKIPVLKKNNITFLCFF